MLTESGRIKGKYTGWAAYANMGFDITERLNVELGVRYTEDEKDFSTWVYEPDSYLGPYFIYGFATDGYITDTKKWDDTTFRGLVTYAPTENSMIFASYTQGFKSGGFGSFWVEDSSGAVPAYETVSQGAVICLARSSLKRQILMNSALKRTTSMVAAASTWSSSCMNTKTCR